MLWKEVMDFLHDAGEEELEEEEKEEEEQEADTAVEPAPPASHSAAGAHMGLTDEELAGLDATSVELLPDADREAALAAPAAERRSSGPGPALAGPSGPPSTAGSVPATARAYSVNVGQPELEKLGHASRRRVCEDRCGVGPEPVSRRDVTTRTSPDSEAGRGPVLGRHRPRREAGLDLPGGSQERRGGEDSSLRARLAAMEMELEALKRDSDGGASQVGGAATNQLVEALKAQLLRLLRWAVVARAPSLQSRRTWHGPP